MLTEILVLTALLSSPLIISVLVLWSAHRGYLHDTARTAGN